MVLGCKPLSESTFYFSSCFINNSCSSSGLSSDSLQHLFSRLIGVWPRFIKTCETLRVRICSPFRKRRSARACRLFVLQLQTHVNLQQKWVTHAAGKHSGLLFHISTSRWRTEPCRLAARRLTSLTFTDCREWNPGCNNKNRPQNHMWRSWELK